MAPAAARNRDPGDGIGPRFERPSSRRYIPTLLLVALVPLLLLAGAAQAVEPTTPLLDDFNRANEDPIGSSNGAWARADTIWQPGRLDDSAFAPREASRRVIGDAAQRAQALGEGRVFPRQSHSRSGGFRRG